MTLSKEKIILEYERPGNAQRYLENSLGKILCFVYKTDDVMNECTDIFQIILKISSNYFRVQ